MQILHAILLMQTSTTMCMSFSNWYSKYQCSSLSVKDIDFGPWKGPIDSSDFPEMYTNMSMYCTIK